MTTEQIEYRHVAFGQLDTRLDADGTFSGYANLHEITDSYGTRFAKGAWESASESGKRAYLWMHSPDNPIGVFDWREDEKGLYIEGKFDDTTAGRDARARARSGSAPELSVGFIRRSVDSEDGNRITAAELKEVSQITLGFASQPGAELTAIRKAAEIMQRMDDDGKIDDTVTPPVIPDVPVENEDATTIDEAASTPDTPDEVPPEAKPDVELEETDEQRAKVTCSGCGKSLRNAKCTECSQAAETKSADSEVEQRQAQLEKRAWPPIAGSYEERIEQVRQAVKDWADNTYTVGDDEELWTYSEATFGDSVVATVSKWSPGDNDSETFRFSYGFVDGGVQLGEPEKAEVVSVVREDGTTSERRIDEGEKPAEDAKDEERDERERLELQIRCAMATN